MENNQQQILSEIKSLMASVRFQLEELDAKIAQWQQCVEPDEVIDMVSVIDLDLGGGLSVSLDDAQQEVQQESADDLEQDTTDDDIPVEDALPVEDPIEDSVAEDVLPVVDQIEDVLTEDDLPSEVPVEDSVAEDVLPVVDQVEDVLTEDDLPSEVPVEDSVAEDALPVVDQVEDVLTEDIPSEDMSVNEALSEDEDDDLPFFEVPEDNVFGQPDVKAQKPQVQKSVERPAVIDVMTQKHAWRTAMAGAPVKDIRGAIALMDRVLFINTLFGTDPMAFQDALTQINQMHTLDEAVQYLASTHPEWDFDSEVVYSFMMAVRRKVNS